MPLLIVLPEERDKLLELHRLDELVFNYLAERTDYESGSVGVRSAVSYGRIALDLSEKMERKAKGDLLLFSRSQVRESVRRMTKVGLFRNISNVKDKRLQLVRVFYAELLDVDYSVQKAVPPQSPVKLPDVILNFLFYNRDLKENNKSSPHRKGKAVPTSRKTYLLTNRDQEKNEKPAPGGKFRIDANWRPSEDFVTIAKQTMFDVKEGGQHRKLMMTCLADMLLYWPSPEAEEHGHELYRSQQRWEQTLLRDMKRAQHQKPPTQPPASNAASGGKQRIPKLPWDNEQLIAFAKKWGLPQPAHDGSSWERYRNKLEAARIRENDKRAH